MYTMGKDMSSPMIGSNMGKMMRQNMYQIVPSWDETPMEDVAGNVGNNMDNTMMGAGMVQNMGHNMIGHNMDKTMMGAGMVQNMGHNMMGHNMDKTMMGAPMVQNMGHNMMGHNMDKTMMGAPMIQNIGHNNKITGFNMFGFPMFGFPMMGQKSYTNMMGRDMASNMVGQDMPSHMMDRSMMGSQDMYTNANLMGHDMNRMAPVNMMSQKMQIETMPSQSFTRFF